MRTMILPRGTGFMAALVLAVSVTAPASATAGATASATAGATSSKNTLALRLRFAEARGLAAVGRWADALAMFEEVARAKPTPHVMFHIATCNEQLGRLQEAGRIYRKARDAARGNDAGVAAESESRLLALEMRMPRLTVHLEGAPEKVTLLVDGVAAMAAEVIRLDPGPHVVVAMREGQQVAAAALSVLEWQARSVRLRIYPA